MYKVLLEGIGDLADSNSLIINATPGDSITFGHDDVIQHNVAEANTMAAL